MNDKAEACYAVLAHESDNWWTMKVPKLPGVLTGGRTITEAANRVLGAIALEIGVPANSFSIRVTEAPATEVTRDTGGPQLDAEEPYGKETK